MAYESKYYEDDFGLTNNNVHDDSEQWDQFENQSVEKNWLFYTMSIACPIVILGGVFPNILAFVVLVRSRLWLKHEAYVYLAANFCVNVGILLLRACLFLVIFVHEWRLYYPLNMSAFVCNVGFFLMNIFYGSGWPTVAFLFNIYLREHLMKHRQKTGCLTFAAKYCTLFATKISVGVIFGVLFVLSIPYVVIFEFQPENGCLPSEGKSFYVVVAVEWILMWVLPFVFFLPIILVMTLCTKREGNIIGLSKTDQRSVADDQMRTMAITLSSIILVSQLDVMLFHRGYKDNLAAYIFVELAFCLCLGLLQPVLCFRILKDLRDGLRCQLRNIRWCSRLFPSLDRDEKVSPPITTELCFNRV